MHSVHTAARVCAVLACGGTALGSDILFDNYFGPDNGTARGGAFYGYAPGLFDPPFTAPVTEIANRFDVSGGSFTLETVEATMFWFSEIFHGNPINDGVILRIHDSNNGLPGAVLGTVSALGPLDLPPSGGPPVVTATPIVFDFTGAGIVLQDGNSYWLSAEAANGGFAVWGAALRPDSDPLDPTILGSVQGYQAERMNGNEWFGPDFGPDFGAFRVSGSLVPTPSAAVILSLAGVVATRRRRSV